MQGINECQKDSVFSVTNNVHSSNPRRSDDFEHLLQFLARKLDREGDARPLAVELLMSVAQQDIQLLRAFILGQFAKSKDGCPNLLAIIIRLIVYGGSISIRWHMVAVLRLLLDTPSPGVIVIKRYCEYS